jgi:aerobic C4-dicarboxylate transport protein
MATVFLAQVYNVDLSLRQQLGILAVLMVTSKGAAGVTGSGFIVLASTLQAMKVVPVEGIALLLGVDRFMSEARAITNLIGNGVATLVISRSEGAFDEGRRQLAERPSADQAFGVAPAGANGGGFPGASRAPTLPGAQRPP